VAGVVVEPHLTCAFALRSTPGAYALLLGAGISVPSGVKSAWGVQEELIRRTALMLGEEPEDPFAWYEAKYGKPSTYDDLLEGLAATQTERQALLREFFEPNEAEREEGLKEPTLAHRAVARLVASGLVRVVLTINFDRLLETALRDEGIEPTVVSAPSDIPGLNPLHAQRCLVVHLHGDYLNPSGMLNTAQELGSYPPTLDRLLDQVLSEYGLLIAGWSATWDTALRAAVARNPNPYYATFWVDPFPLSGIAEDLRVKKRATYVETFADDFFGRLADACQSLADTERRHPVTVQVAVATAKRALAGTTSAIPLHDMIREELERLRGLDVLTGLDVNQNPVEQVHAQRLERIEAAMEVPLALCATTAYWGTADTDRWWFSDISRFGTQPSLSGFTALINLVQLPATALLYATGIAAVARGRLDLVARLFREPTTTNNYGNDVPVAAQLAPGEVVGVVRAHRRLHEYLRPLLQSHLALGEVAYTDASEQFEYLRLAFVTDMRLAEGGLTQKIEDLYSDRHEAKFGLLAATNETPYLDQERLDEIDAELNNKLPESALRVPMRVPHIRALGHSNAYLPAPAKAVAAQVKRLGDRYLLLTEGLFGGSRVRLEWALRAVDHAFNTFASDAAFSTVTGTAGFLPSGGFYPDEIGKWAL
jgi:hypothetical protein